jgi:hypothetical protein
MKVCLVYIFPQINLPVYEVAAKRFVDSYFNNPPGAADHEIHVCLNGGSGHGPYQEKIFNPLPVTWMEHNNWGKDIGAFQVASHSLNCDLLVCFGSHIYFHRPGWLDRMVRAFEDYGPTIYGAWGQYLPTPHIRTTGFWLPPDLLRLYPYQIGDRDRYSFEHGSESITLWCQKLGFDPMQVTWNGDFNMSQWHGVNRQESLFYDQWFDGRGGP